jgi:S-(hydroxymethyl)glutathione dehydrogenase/alcohol dehydrogenase
MANILNTANDRDRSPVGIATKARGDPQMKALVVNTIGGGFDYVEDVDIAAPIRREVLVDVKASGLCHTDVLMASNDIFPIPAVFGHEVAGVITEVGPEVSQFQAGDHVVATLTQSCGTCARCLGGRSFQCARPEATLRGASEPPRLSRRGVPLFQGMGIGGFAEQALIHENQLAPLPAGVPFAQGALLGCGVVTGAGAVLNTASVAAGDSVVVFGAGGVGLNAISGALVAGASRIIAIDLNPVRLDAAKQFGATDVIDSSTTDPVGAVRDVLPNGADHVFDFVGAEAVADAALAMLGVGGGLYLIGVTRPDASFRFSPMDAIAGQKRAQGVNYGSTNFKRDIPMYADLYLEGRLNLDDLVSRTIALGDVNQGYADIHEAALNRVVVTAF